MSFQSVMFIEDIPYLIVDLFSENELFGDPIGENFSENPGDLTNVMLKEKFTIYLQDFESDEMFSFETFKDERFCMKDNICYIEVPTNFERDIGFTNEMGDDIIKLTDFNFGLCFVTTSGNDYNDYYLVKSYEINDEQVVLTTTKINSDVERTIRIPKNENNLGEKLENEILDVPITDSISLLHVFC